MHRSSIATVAMVALLWLPGVASAATILTQATPTTWTLISDGTSNTILFPENPIDVRDGSFDVCFARVGITTITDGTSNTIQIGEHPRCFQDVALVPAPAALSVSAMALLASLWRGRRRQQ